MLGKACRVIGVLVLLSVTPGVQGNLESDGTLVLKAGLNLISFPNAFSPSTMTSQGLGALFGSSLLAVSRIEPVTQGIETTTFVGGGPAGADFPIVAGEGYYLDMAADVSELLTGDLRDLTVNLQPGVNLVGFNPVRPGFTAYELLKFIGSPDVITSVRRFDRSSARYQSAFQVLNNIGGENFVIVPGEAYLISMLQPVTGVVVPEALFFTRASDSFLMVREVTSAGGGKSTDSAFILQSVVGQSTPLGAMSDGDFNLNGGFLPQ